MGQSKQVSIEWDSLPWTERLETLHDISRRAALYNEFRLKVVNEILKPAGVEARDYKNQAKAIYDWAKENIYYSPEAGEHLQHPMVTMESLVGDCDDFALFIAAACHSIGLPYRFVFVGSNWEARRGEDVLTDPEHIYLEIGTPPLVDISEATGKMGVSIPYCKADASDPNGSFCDRVRMGQTSKQSGGWLISLGVIGAILLILLLVKGR